MTTLIAGTWSLLYSSAEVIARARRMTLRIHGVLQPGLLEMSAADRRRLLGLQKRMECLAQPLSFLLIWSKKRDSCVQQVVLNAQELLFDVCSFVERFTPQDGARPVGAKPGDIGIDSDQLEHYLRELEFACSAVSMAVSIARVHDAPVSMDDLQGLDSAGVDEAGEAFTSIGCNGISLFVLLRASRRIQEMQGRGGVVCACPGRFYKQAEESDWNPVFAVATFKVVASSDAKVQRQGYRISVESSLPLGRRHDSPEPGDCELQTTGSLTFPIDVALDARLTSSAQMVFLADSAETSFPESIPGNKELVLIWHAPAECSAADEVSLEFPDAVLIAESSADAMPLPLRSVSKRCSSPAAHSCRYAFVFAAPRVCTAELRAEAQAGPPPGDGEIELSPLDVLYLARLCALDDGQRQHCAQDVSVGASCPPHLLASDEVLVALLQAGVCSAASIQPAEESPEARMAAAAAARAMA